MRWIYSVAALILSFVLIGATNSQTSPEIELVSASCFTDIYADDDLYCGVIYNLPEYVGPLPISTPEAWCAELFNQDGCVDNPVNPSEPTSLVQNSVLVTIEDTVNGSLAGINLVPRIGFSVTGVYLPAGHGVVYGSADYEICVEANEDIYLTLANRVCDQPVWNSLAQTANIQRSALGEFFKFAMVNKGLVEARSNDFYMSDNLINVTGAEIVEEALPNATKLLPNTFSASLNTIIISTPTPVATQFSDVISAANPQVDLFYNTTADDLSITADGLKIGVSIGVALVSFVAGFWLMRNVVFAGLVMLAALITFMPFDLIYMPGFFAMLGIMSIFAGGFIVRKVVIRG